ncbi:CopG family transcriptional regulator [Sandaracinobacter neustonicus]|uniref:CopG family transcriptional regulator n=1 Tax=Alphaproteobacteria TaxID=28211 RepID=UPI001A9C9AC1|nr:CopG family transcriptional regulator [Sandaracinobacter neustonicus]
MTAWSCDLVTGRKKKTQISVYLDPEIMAMLSDYAARREQSLSLVAEAALASFLSPDDAERREAIVARRLDQLDRRMTRIERDVGISVETLAVFIRFWINSTPALPEPAAQAARAKAGERYERFVAALGRRLAQGPKLRQEISEDVDGDSSKAGSGKAEDQV